MRGQAQPIRKLSATGIAHAHPVHRDDASRYPLIYATEVHPQIASPASLRHQHSPPQSHHRCSQRCPGRTANGGSTLEALGEGDVKRAVPSTADQFECHVARPHCSTRAEAGQWCAAVAGSGRRRGLGGTKSPPARSRVTRGARSKDSLAAACAVCLCCQ